MLRLEIINLKVQSFANISLQNNVIGVSRSLIAFGTFITLLLTDIKLLINPNNIDSSVDSLYEFSYISIFSYVNLYFAKTLSMIILFITIIGWKPRIFSILHFWITYSFMVSCATIDGGDVTASIITFLLVIVFINDNRSWHWVDIESGFKTQRQLILNLLPLSTFFIIRLQISIIYLHAFVAKLGVQEWIDGTVPYYLTIDNSIGANDLFINILTPFLINPYIVFIFCWLTLIIELILFGGLFVKYERRKYFLFLGIIFHFSIAVLFGLYSFFFTMAGVLVLFLGPYKKGFIFNIKD